MSESITSIRPRPAHAAAAPAGRPARLLTVAGLLAGAAGIGLLWAAGVPFPVVVPPGLVILAVTALVVGLVRRRWTSAVAVLVGLFLLVGFLMSPAGIADLTGHHGALAVLGQAVMVVGVAVATVSGVVLGLRRG